MQEPLFDSDEEPTTSGVRSRTTANKQAKKRQQLEENFESDEEVIPKKSKQAKRVQPKKSAAPKKTGWLDSDSEGEVYEKAVKNPQTLQSAVTRRVADGVVRRTANLEGDVFVEVKVYNSADISLIDPKDKWEHAVLALKFRTDGDAPELRSLKDFIKKCKAHFTNEGKKNSNKKI